MNTDEQLAWVAISQCPGVGIKRFGQLLDYFEKIRLNPLQFWLLSAEELKQLDLKENFKEVFLNHKRNFSIENTQNDFIRKNISVLLKKDDLYPALLKEIPDGPPVLYIQGVIKPKFTLPIAVVGTRKVTSYGRMVTQQITTELVQQGAEIISGFMYGVDAIAHQTAIKTQGYTIAVIGYGFDFSYPESHTKLKSAVLEKGGALISEYLPSTPPIPGQFPQRNRIVAGMSRGVLVTEAAKNSGSKITAGLAAEYGRDVFAVPGPITSPYSEGTKDLINNGAKLVSCASDILEEYYPQRSGKTHSIDIQQIISQAEGETEKMILEVLVQQSLNSDDISSELQMSSSELLSALSLLEMRGVVGLEGGKYFVKF